jgi:hypothetical protein
MTFISFFRGGSVAARSTLFNRRASERLRLSRDISTVKSVRTRRTPDESSERAGATASEFLKRLR